MSTSPTVASGVVVPGHTDGPHDKPPPSPSPPPNLIDQFVVIAPHKDDPDRVEKLEFAVSEMQTQINGLRCALVSQDMDHSGIVSSLQEGLDQRDVEIDGLKRRLHEVDFRFQKQVRGLRFKLSGCHEDLERERRQFDVRITKLRQFEDIADRLESDKRQLLLQIQQLKDENERICLTNESHLTDVLMSHSEKISVLENDLLEVQTREEVDLHQRALSMVSAKRRQILKDNQILSKQMNELQYKFKHVCQQKSELLETFQTQKRNLQTSKHQFLLLSRQQQRKCHLIQQLQQQIEQLNKHIQMEQLKHQKQQIQYKQQTTQQIQQLERSLQSKDHLLRLRTGELIKLKQISSRILSQRSELEAFFMDAMAFVRNQKQQQKSTSTTQTQTTVHLPDINQTRTSPPFLEQEQTEEGHRDFSQLDWEEKEQVLRLLFSRLNGRRIHVSSSQE